MKKVSKWIFLMLALVLVVSAASQAEALTITMPQNRGEAITSWRTNPVYEGVMDQTAFAQTLVVQPAAAQEDAEYLSEEEASAYIREEMVDRSDEFTVEVVSDIYPTDEELYAFVDGLVFDAVEHTGVPDEGDYLKWQYGGFQCGISYYTSGGKGYYSLSYYFSYYTTAEQEEEVEEAVEDLLETMDLKKMSDYEKISAIYDYICENVTYDYEALENPEQDRLAFTAYGALIEHNCVCQGYANLLYRLALEVGVDCRLISGTSSKQAHGWNIVELGNVYYNLDSTWDAGATEYDYFLKCDENFLDHYRDAEYATEAFYSAYPMAGKDYVPGTHPEENIVASGICGENLTWTLDKNGTLTISGTGAMTNYDWEASAPWSDYQEQITSVVMAEGVTSVGNYAFYCCEELTSVTLPADLTTIGTYAFASCVNLPDITIPDTVTSIDACAFLQCSGLSNVVIPNHVTSIGEGAFYFCTNLTSVTIPDSVTSIGNRAFAFCNLQASVTIPSSVTSIGNGPFAGCPNLTGIYVDEDNLNYCNDDYGVLFNKDQTELIQVPAAITGSYTIPDGVAVINAYAFHSCDKLVDVTIPDSVTSINAYAFTCCNDLASVTIPASVTAIRDYVFSHCADLKDITFCGNAPSFGRGVFSGNTATACYPANNETWTTDVMQNYDGTITWEAYYEVIEGEDSTVEVGSEEALSIRAAGEIDKFECVIVDGEIVDPSKYTVTEGSTIITFTPEYVANLTEGDHEIVIRFADGIATATVTVESAYLPGDVNGDGKVNGKDGVMLAQYLAEWGISIDMNAADVNGDGKVNGRDGILLAQYLAEWDVTLG